MNIIHRIPDQAVFTKSRAAKYLSICEKTLRKLTEAGEIEAHERWGQRIYLLEDLDRFRHSYKPWTPKERKMREPHK